MVSPINHDDVQAPEFPTARGCPFAEPSGYATLRAGGAPVSRVTLYDGRQVWIVTGYEAARQVLVDNEGFSSVRNDPRFPATAPRFAAASKIRNFLGMDPPDHTRQRRPLTSSFTVKRMASYRPGIQRIVDGLLDDLLAKEPTVDLVPAFALPVPSMAICHILGVPYADHSFFEEQSRRIVHGESSLEESTQAFANIRSYMADLIDAKRRERGDGLLDEMVTIFLDSGELTRDELSEMALLLLVAGHETTANAIALGVLTLLERPVVRNELGRTPPLISNVVEELLRLLSIADGVPRFATRDTEIAGQPVAAGDGVIVAIAASNRDTAVFSDPDTFDPHRSARRHLAFGYGIHQCLGQNLARAEMEIALSTVFTRIPTLRLAVPPEEIQLKHPAGLHGVVALPVTW
ncbi:cytochrome P450 [Streptomyces sp. NPDC007983]|uniref:cytochrome P450 n=1 Tax=Streptomyces sp. NPDC007983 TaxID=3364800 RepID=UPI0036EFE3D3